MREEPQNSCKNNGLVHAWEDITPNTVYPTNPPQYPNEQEQCLNCGLVRTFYRKIEGWLEYELREKPIQYGTSITVSNGLVDMGVGGTTLNNIPFTTLKSND